jgi:glycosyltransferase involved in cell wall biosynthesis
MRISWLSNASWAATGYGNQTKLFAPRIKRMLGYDIAISAFYGLDGGMITIEEGIPVMPKGRHPYGQDIAAEHAKTFGADIIISLLDAWVCDPDNLQTYGHKWVPWFPIDMEPLCDPVKHKVAKAFRRIVFSKFGERMMNDAGLDCYYVPHGVDTKMFAPGDKIQARAKLKLPQDVFLVGMVAANKGYPPRKAFFENIKAFAQLHKKHPDTVLYLHTMPGGQNSMQNSEVNLPEFCEHLGLKSGRDFWFAHPYQLSLGYPDEAMVDLYNAMDVHLLVSMGEGFGIPILEAQSCGTPVIVGDWTAMSELCFSGWKVDKSEAVDWWTPLAAWQWLPNAGAIADRLEMAYRLAGNSEYAKNARKGALKYDADRVTEKYWKPVLADIEEALQERVEVERIAV